ncbi:hypothetical protein [Parvicella tangerina]|uniref:Lipoprotein n=1 Tax=Parvicella tangerina TaxID=2829795 RepID=A0A916JMS4_9FLAO|nr:hypothetical protein [Parvicella tangerina]CAG5082011.1 hypothetical protein CRYO30217_01785 [Parvicella tangerina]
MNTIKSLFFSVIILIVLGGCKNKPDDYYLRDLQEAGVKLTVTKNKLGDFQLGQIIYEYELENQLHIVKYPNSYGSSKAYSVKFKGDELMVLSCEYDFTYGYAADELDMIWTKSKYFTTDKGLGVGSTIEEILAAYPDAKISPCLKFNGISVAVLSGQVHFLFESAAYRGSVKMDKDFVITTDRLHLESKCEILAVGYNIY